MEREARELLYRTTLEEFNETTRTPAPPAFEHLQLFTHILRVLSKQWSLKRAYKFIYSLVSFQ